MCMCDIYMCVYRGLFCVDLNPTFVLVLTPVNFIWPVNRTPSLPRITTCHRTAGINTSVHSRAPIIMPFPPYLPSVVVSWCESPVTIARSAVWVISPIKQFLWDNFNSSQIHYLLCYTVTAWSSCIWSSYLPTLFSTINPISYSPLCLLLRYITQRPHKDNEHLTLRHIITILSSHTIPASNFSSYYPDTSSSYFI